VCPLFLIIGLWTRLNAAVLTVTLRVAVLQNQTADRDPQLAVLYTLVVAALALGGGGRWSVDSVWSARVGQRAQATTVAHAIGPVA
jgi:uncharacterized membrane protein YphA (DoxX/SURF4 family)